MAGGGRVLLELGTKQRSEPRLPAFWERAGDAPGLVAPGRALLGEMGREHLCAARARV